MQTITTYRPPQPEERMTIAILYQRGSTVRAIARNPGHTPWTISRELALNVGSDGSYSRLPAQALSRSRRIQARPAVKLHHDTPCRASC